MQRRWVKPTQQVTEEVRARLARSKALQERLRGEADACRSMAVKLRELAEKAREREAQHGVVDPA